MVPPWLNCGGGRDGFGAGRQDRGAGRFRGRGRVWQRAEGGRGGDDHGGHGSGQRDPPPWADAAAEAYKQEDSETNMAAPGEGKDEGQSHAHSNWDRQIKNQDPNPGSSKVAGKRNEFWGEGHRDGKAPASEGHQGCRFCGLRNHGSEECMRRNPCEICGYNNHITSECKREPIWSFGPELCAAQVEDQSFFFIEDNIDTKATMEKSSTAIITVLSGEANAKQNENEFKRFVSSKFWKWSARKLADNRFSLRFPDAQLVQMYSNFSFLGMKEADAQIKVEPWSPSAGAKGELQQAWFRIKGIPSDQRSIKTIAKIGGLVGKTMAIDEKSRTQERLC